jgi:hypothetical protein
VRKIRQVTFAGGHYDRGLARGRRLRGSLVVPPPRDVPARFIEECVRAAVRFHPPCAEEFEGLLRGGEFSRDEMTAHYFARLESRLGGCTMFAVQPECTRDGAGPIVGRNYDWAVEDLKWCELHRYLPERGARRIAYTHHWAGCPDVLNEHGLYVAIASLPAQPVRRPGVQWSILVEAVSETCARVDEAVRMCAGVRHLRSMSYLLADAAGNVVVVEATPDEVRLRSASEGYVVAANASLGGVRVGPPDAGPSDYAMSEPVGAVQAGERAGGTGTSQEQGATVSAMLAASMPEVSEEVVRRILQEHTTPICRGDHRDPDGAPWATIWSATCRPAEGTFAVAPGLPCRHRYQSFRVCA